MRSAKSPPKDQPFREVQGGGTPWSSESEGNEIPVTRREVSPVGGVRKLGPCCHEETRWKVENENNNTLKTQGYNLEHNFGHGQQHLAAVLATLNILSLLFHTLLGWLDAKYQQLQEQLGTRKTFFDDLRALTRYMYFRSWDQLLAFMIDGLELVTNPDTS